jgi:hypothetical protein
MALCKMDVKATATIFQFPIFGKQEGNLFSGSLEGKRKAGFLRNNRIMILILILILTPANLVDLAVLSLLSSSDDKDSSKAQ